MEKIIVRRLTFHLHSHNLLPKEQFGFREGHSTTDQLLYFCQRIRDAHNWKPTNHTVAVLMDLSKAFDRVWNNFLVTKLYKMFGIGGKALPWIYDFLRNRLIRKLEKVLLSAARIITGLRNTCPRDIVLFEVDLQLLSLRRRACLTKYYNKLRSLDSQNCTSAYFKDWCNNQRHGRNIPFNQMVSFNLIIGAVEPHHLSQCLDSVGYLDGVFFHPELPVHMDKQTDLPAYLKQLALERIGDIPTDAIQVYTDGSRDDYYRSGSGIYIKSQDHNKNP
ncbi:reverse transcriptase domain-containing protein [Trichonephila clavipes]|nr:reverse transcriptase domain-containing protein [Trichonephila clavipes]